MPWPPGSTPSDADAAALMLPSGSKKALKKYVMRWHPDKFQQRYGPRLCESDKERILDRVKAVSQAVNQKWSQLT